VLVVHRLHGRPGPATELFETDLMPVITSLPAGPFTWQQATSFGLTRKALQSLIDNRQVVRVLRGVYQAANLPSTAALRIEAARLVVNQFVVVCDRLAAWVYGVEAFSIAELQGLPAIDTCVPPDKTRVRRKGCTGCRRDLDPEDVVVFNGVRITSDLRTALDLGCGLGRRDAMAALDGFMRVRGLTRPEFEVQLPRYASRRGVVQLRRLVPLADARAESAGESWTRMAILDAGLPAPELQYSVRVGGRELYRLDMAYVRERIVIEYDGVRFHDSPEQREYDRVRRQWLRAHGWAVIVVHKESFTGDALMEWTERLRRMLWVAS
jgi:Protein of unknown function (DUF559)